MNVFFRWALRLGWVFSAPVVMCRVVTATVWISGGSDGIVYGGEDLPGWLGLMSHIQENGPEDCWLEVGGTRDWTELTNVGKGRLPEAVVPSEFMLQRYGQELFQQEVPWTLSNLNVLPQFPKQDIPVPASREWKHPDGFSIRMMGLLSGKAPLRIPPSQLRPLRVMDPARHLQQSWVRNPPASNACHVVVLPEKTDVKELSHQLPEAMVLVEPVGGRPQVVELEKGARLRVRPGEFGRALIRVDIKWDTVRKTFLNPRAEVVWVREPNLERFELPPSLVERVRPYVPVVTEGTIAVYVPSSDLPRTYSFTPTSESWRGPRRLYPGNFHDADKLNFYGQDHVILRIRMSPADMKELKSLKLPLQLSVGKEPVLTVYSDFASGNGGDEWMVLRNFLDAREQISVTSETIWEKKKGK